jgi:hypothetical protein
VCLHNPLTICMTWSWLTLTLITMMNIKPLTDTDKSSRQHVVQRSLTSGKRSCTEATQRITHARMKRVSWFRFLALVLRSTNVTQTSTSRMIHIWVTCLAERSSTAPLDCGRGVMICTHPNTTSCFTTTTRKKNRFG